MSIEELANSMSEQFQARARALGFKYVNDYLDHLAEKSIFELMHPKRFPENMGMTKVPEMQRT